MHAGSTPRFDRASWTFHIWGLVEKPWQCNYDEFLAQPHVQVHADMHCVTRWSKLDMLWEGISTRTVLEHVKPLPQARFVMVHCEYGFTTNLPLDDFLGEDCLFAWKCDWPGPGAGPRLSAAAGGAEVVCVEERQVGARHRADGGGPAWLLGEWEHGGYHMRGDPWTGGPNGDGERFRDR